MQNEQIEKLKKQVAKYEAKGYTDTAAHQVLANLLKEHPAEGVPFRNAKKAKQENLNNGE